MQDSSEEEEKSMKSGKSKKKKRKQKGDDVSSIGASSKFAEDDPQNIKKE